MDAKNKIQSMPAQDAYDTTPKAFTDKAVHLRGSYAELQQDLQQENSIIESKLLNPAIDAKDSIAPLKRVVKKREDTKLDFERYNGRAETARRKDVKSQRDEAALQRHEMNLSQATYVSRSIVTWTRKCR